MCEKNTINYKIEIMTQVPSDPSIYLDYDLQEAISEVFKDEYGIKDFDIEKHYDEQMKKYKK
jgi:hypothetical protein